ncbi:pirin family protein [Paraburkholderia hayleyella]|uniref:pirin family protein n=1 Tax=Paraburkholderia hayleyella TaxID=2152889 RepID=UPI0012913CF7|nr:pirin family protein [Paraburkholderia hayleyella]
MSAPVKAPVKAILKPHPRDIGGFTVARVLPAMDARLIGPFIFFDYMDQRAHPSLPGAGMDVLPHPHIGIATVTYLFEGALMHRDSVGSVQKIVPGDVNWMTAGRGIVHSERTPAAERASGQLLRGIQSWVALPASHAEIAPSFEHHAAASLPRIVLDGVTLQLLAGSALGHTSPVTTYSPMLYAAAHFAAASRFTFDAEQEERGVYLVEGELALDGTPLAPLHMAVLTPGERVTLTSHAGATVMLIGGQKLAGEHLIEWNFVASTRARLERARDAWAAQTMGQVPGETGWIAQPPRKPR